MLRVSGSANMVEVMLREGEGGLPLGDAVAAKEVVDKIGRLLVDADSPPLSVVFAGSDVCLAPSSLANGFNAIKFIDGMLGTHRAKPVGSCGVDVAAAAMFAAAQQTQC